MAQWYRQALSKALNKEWDLDSDNLVATLHTSSYAPNLDTHAYVSDLSAELGSGGGYTVGGAALSGVARTYTAANSWGTVAATSTAYAVGVVVRPASGNGYLYRAITAGTSGSSAPSWGTTVGGTTTDGTVTWECVGSGVTVVALPPPTWSSFTAGPFRYTVISDRTPGTAATQPLVALIDWTADKTGSGGPYTWAAPSQGSLLLFAA
jgi:hypothetical protein